MGAGAILPIRLPADRSSTLRLPASASDTAASPQTLLPDRTSSRAPQLPPPTPAPTLSRPTLPTSGHTLPACDTEDPQKQNPPRRPNAPVVPTPSPRPP